MNKNEKNYEMRGCWVAGDGWCVCWWVNWKEKMYISGAAHSQNAEKMHFLLNLFLDPLLQHFHLKISFFFLLNLQFYERFV